MSNDPYFSSLNWKEVIFGCNIPENDNIMNLKNIQVLEAQIKLENKVDFHSNSFIQNLLNRIWVKLGHKRLPEL